MRRRDHEKKTLRLMIGIYCRGNHRAGPELCEDCRALLAYAEKRLDACSFMEKPACSDCAVHCYAPDKRASIRAVMRYAGPRMVLHAPLEALAHALRPRPKRKPCGGKDTRP